VEFRLITVCVLSFGLGGCWSPLGEVLASHIAPGGAVKAALDGGPMHSSNGLVTALAEPLKITAQASNVSVGIEAAISTDGVTTAKVALATAGQTVTLNFGSGGSRLHLYADQMGCVATAGTMTLRTDSNNNLEGEVAASGTRTGSQDTCVIEVTLKGVPIDPAN